MEWWPRGVQGVMGKGCARGDGHVVMGKQVLT